MFAPPDDSPECLVEQHKALARARLAKIGATTLSDEAISRAAEMGWVHRSHANNQRQLEEEENRRLQGEKSLLDVHNRVLRLPTYLLDSVRDKSASELDSVLRYAKLYPNDAKAQELASRVQRQASTLPVHLDSSQENATRIAAAGNKDALDRILQAMRNHKTDLCVQRRSCESLWHLTDSKHVAQMAEELVAIEALSSTMQRFPRDCALQVAASAALSNIVSSRTPGPLSPYTHQAIGNIQAAMANHPHDMRVQKTCSVILWELGSEDPCALAQRPGLKHAAEHAASLGVPEASWLRDHLPWQTPAEAHGSRGGGRKRWGQWAVGRSVPA
jgi:hypothetical protein